MKERELTAVVVTDKDFKDFWKGLTVEERREFLAMAIARNCGMPDRPPSAFIPFLIVVALVSFLAAFMVLI